MSLRDGKDTLARLLYRQLTRRAHLDRGTTFHMRRPGPVTLREMLGRFQAFGERVSEFLSEHRLASFLVTVVVLVLLADDVRWVFPDEGHIGVFTWVLLSTDGVRANRHGLLAASRTSSFSVSHRLGDRHHACPPRDDRRRGRVPSACDVVRRLAFRCASRLGRSEHQGLVTDPRLQTVGPETSSSRSADKAPRRHHECRPSICVKRPARSSSRTSSVGTRRCRGVASSSAWPP
jgi:hypothetical protein